MKSSKTLLILIMLLVLANSSQGQGGTVSLSVIAYNIQMLPTSIINTYQQERLPYLHQQLKDYDVVVFSEAFDDDIRRKLAASMATSFPYHTCILARGRRCAEGDRFICQDGGVIIFSKYLIEAEDQRTFYPTTCQKPWKLFSRRRECAGSDCLSGKGVLYARINKEGVRYHIFGSHTQASYDSNPRYRQVRELQFRMIHEFINEKNISKEETVIIAGDLNVDRLSAPHEYEAMLQMLQAIHPELSGPGYTYHPSGNCLHKDKKLPSEYLDYILFRKDHRLPNKAVIETKVLKTDKPYRMKHDSCSDLSDHYAVAAQFTF